MNEIKKKITVEGKKIELKNDLYSIQSPYFDKNGKPIFLGNDLKWDGKEGTYQMRIRHGYWVIYPIMSLCYFVIKDNKFKDSKNRLVDLELAGSISNYVGFIGQELIKPFAVNKYGNK